MDASEAERRKGGGGEEGAQREEGARVYRAPSLSWVRNPEKRGEREKLRVYPETPSGTMTIVRRKEGR